MRVVDIQSPTQAKDKRNVDQESLYVSYRPGPSQPDQSTTVFNDFTCRVIKSSPSSQLTTVGQGWTIPPAIAGRFRLLITAGVFWKGNVESANRV